MERQAALKRLLAPRTIAFYGGNSAAEAIRQCLSLGYDGEIWPVNPNRTEICGIPCFRSADDLPSAPDASMVAARAEASVEIVRDLAQRGAGGAVCYASGFGELGADGLTLEHELREAAGELAVVGPNCHGFINYLDRVALWPDQHGGRPVDSGVAVVSQSGNFGINLSMQQRSVDMGYIITIGNSSCLGLHDYIEHLITDPRVTAIGLHIEGISDVHRFSAAAIKALESGVPIIAIKTGRSARGAELNRSHTASLAGEDRLYSALFRRLGIARCNTVSQFLETLKFLSVVGPLRGSRVGSMSCSGGETSLIADYADALSLDLPPLSGESSARLRRVLGPKVPLSNPLDYHTYAWGNREKLRDCFSAMLANEFDCTMLVLDYPPGTPEQTANWEVAENALGDAVRATGQTAVIASTLPETLPHDVRSRLLDSGFAPMQGLDDCLFAIRAAADIGKMQQDPGRVQAVLERDAPGGDVVMLDEWQSKAELLEAGLRIPEGRTCDAREAGAVAESLGFPVALKAVSPALAHKTEAGGVLLGLSDRASVEAAADGLSGRFDRFLVEKMAGPVVAEILVGVRRDETFGLNLLLGTGGTRVELQDDTVSLLLPVERQDIEDALASLKVAKLMDSYRGGERGDADAVVDAVSAIVDYCMKNRATLEEVEINPLIVQPSGAIAVDAVIRQRR